MVGFFFFDKSRLYSCKRLSNPLMPDVAEIISEMNRNAGAEPLQATPPNPAAPVDTPPASPAAPAAGTPPATPPAEPVVKKEDEKYIPPDPQFVRKPTAEPATPTTPPAAAVPGAEPTAPGTPPATEPVADAAFYTRLSELTGGELKDENSFIGVLQHYNELLDEKQKGFEPQFESERAKWAYNLLKANPGKELETAQRQVHALSLTDKMDKMAPKELLFQAYLLDPLNSDLQADEARQYFEDDYAKRFADIENDLSQKRLHAVEVRKAKDQISAIQSEYKAVEAVPQKISQEVEESIGRVVGDFGGIRLSFTENPAETDYLNVAVTDPNELTRLQNNALYPEQAHKAFLDQFRGDNGAFDWQGYVRETWERENHQMLRKQAFDHGKKLGLLEKVNKDRNASTPADIAQNRNPPPAPQTNQPKSILEAWGNAQKAS